MPFALKPVLVIELQLRPEGTVSVNVRLLVNPWIRVMVMVEVVDEPTLTELGELAVIVKSGGTPKVKDAVAV